MAAVAPVQQKKPLRTYSFPSISKTASTHAFSAVTASVAVTARSGKKRRKKSVPAADSRDRTVVRRDDAYCAIASVLCPVTPVSSGVYLSSHRRPPSRVENNQYLRRMMHRESGFKSRSAIFHPTPTALLPPTSYIPLSSTPPRLWPRSRSPTSVIGQTNTERVLTPSPALRLHFRRGCYCRYVEFPNHSELFRCVGTNTRRE
jgi:hypothetical protein